MSQPSENEPVPTDAGHLSEAERAARAAVLGVLLGIALAVFGRRR